MRHLRKQKTAWGEQDDDLFILFELQNIDSLREEDEDGGSNKRAILLDRCVA